MNKTLLSSTFMAIFAFSWAIASDFTSKQDDISATQSSINLSTLKCSLDAKTILNQIQSREPFYDNKGTHVRDKLALEIKEKFNSALVALTENDNLNKTEILKNLADFAVTQEQKLLNLHNQRAYSVKGEKTFEYDKSILRHILDFAQSEKDAE